MIYIMFSAIGHENDYFKVLADKIYTSNEFKKVKENFTVSQWEYWWKFCPLYLENKT